MEKVSAFGWLHRLSWKKKQTDALVVEKEKELLFCGECIGTIAKSVCLSSFTLQMMGSKRIWGKRGNLSDNIFQYILRSRASCGGYL